MVYKLKYTKLFKKQLKLMIKRGCDVSLLKEVIEKLINKVPLDLSYHNHILKGKYEGFYECHIKPDWLLIYFIDDDIVTLTLVETGSHSDLFNL